MRKLEFEPSDQFRYLLIIVSPGPDVELLLLLPTPAPVILVAASLEIVVRIILSKHYLWRLL